MTRYHLTLMGIIAVIVVLVAGYSCGSDDGPGQRSPQTQATNESSPQAKPGATDPVENRQAASVQVEPDRETRLQVSNGPLIVLPAGSTSGPGELVAEKLPETPAPPDEVVSVTGGGWDIRLEDTELVGAATLRFPVQPPDDVPADVVEVLLTFYDQQQQQWVPVESSYDREQQSVTAQVEHLSWWNALTWDYQGLLGSATSSFADFAIAPEPDQPQCPNEDLARADGTSVTSDSDSRVKWCYGESDGNRMLRVVNGRAYPALVSYPSGWDLQRERSDSLAQALGARVIEAVTALPDGRSGIMLDGGQLVTLYPEQPPGSSALVSVEPSSGGYILGNLEYAGSTVEFVGNKLPGVGSRTRPTAEELASCIPELADTAGAAAVDADIAGLESELVGKSLGCAARQVAIQTVYEGFFLSAIEWLSDGSQQIVAGGSGIADTLQPPYQITISTPGEEAAQDQKTTPGEAAGAANDQAWAWGAGGSGQLGAGTTPNPPNSNVPVQVSGLTGVIAVAGGSTHSLALKGDGTVWAWGNNSRGQLGDGTNTDRRVPVQVSGLTDVTAVAGGGDHSLALKGDGTVWAWGKNSRGQLGDGTTTSRLAPVRVSGLTGVAGVAGGNEHSLALKGDGTVWAWGLNSQGQLGDGTTTHRSTPVRVSGLTGVTDVAAGYYHSLVVKGDGTAWAWGHNFFGQLGDGTETYRSAPVRVSGLTGVTNVAAGLYHSLVVKGDGTAWTWGRNHDGQLGDGTTTHRSTPVRVSGLTGVTDVAGGLAHSLAVKGDGTAWAWGSNLDGKLGDGTTTSRSTPVRVSGLTGVTDVAGGYGHSLAVKGSAGGEISDNFGLLRNRNPSSVGDPINLTRHHTRFRYDRGLGR